MAEFHPKLSKQQAAAREASLKLAGSEVTKLMKQSFLTEEMPDHSLQGQIAGLAPSEAQAILADTYQKIMDVTGIPASLLKPVTVVTHEAVAAPDLEINFGNWSDAIEIEKYHRTKPINAIATSPLSRAIDATRTQFEAPSLRYVNKSHEINNDSDE